MKSEIVHILWTAGLDSTYRLVELSRKQGLTIQPHYVKGKKKSTIIELDRIEKILVALKNKKETKSKILTPIVHDGKDLQIDSSTLEAHTDFNKSMWLGYQYLPLSVIAKEYPGLELSIERELNESYAFESKNITLKKVTTNIGDTWVVDETADKNAYIIFRDFTFPIATITKNKEIDNLTQWGYEDIMKLTWFCHHPKKNKAKEYVACGYCNPCSQYIETGLSYLFDKKALYRYNHRNIYFLPLAIRNKITRLKNKLFKKY